MTDFRIDVIVDPSQARAGSRVAVGELSKIEASAEHLSKALAQALELTGIPKSLRNLEQLARSLQQVGANTNQLVLGQDRLVAATESLATAQAREALAAQQAAAANTSLGSAANKAAGDTDRLGDETKGLGDETERTKKKVFDLGTTLKTALAFVGVTIGLQQLVQITDAFTNIQNRLRVVTEGEQELAEVTAELGAIADRTRSSFQGTAELYARVGLASKELGINSQQLLQFTESLNQAIILSGASATEAQAGLIQLSQGLASGALRGDELRSVLEQLPAVADVIAKGLGVTRGELRAMGQEGKITADIVLESFAKARDELAGKFGKSIPTIGQAFTVLRNDTIAFIGGLNDLTGASGFASQGLILIADNLKGVTIAVAALAGVIIAQLVTKAIPALLAQLGLLKVAVLTNPLFLAAGLAAAGIAALVIQFQALNQQIVDVNAALKDVESQGFTDFGRVGDRILKTQKSIESLQKVLKADPTNQAAIKKLEEMTAKLDELKGKAKEYVDAAKKADEQTAKLAETFNKTLEGLDAEVRLLGLSNAEREVATKLIGVEQKLKTAGVDVTPEQRAEVEERLRQIQALTEQNKVLDELRGPEQEHQERLRILRTLLDEAKISQEEYNKALVSQGGPQGPQLPFQEPTPLEELPKDFEFIPRDRFAETLAQLQQEAELLGLSNEEIALRNQLLAIEEQMRAAGQPLNDEQIAALTEQLRLNQELNAQKQEEERLLQQIVGPQQETLRTTDALNSLFNQGKISAEQYEEALSKLHSKTVELGDASQGFGSGFAQAQKNLGDISSLAEGTVVNAFNSAEDALTQFAATGKAEIGDLVNSILADLSRLLARQALLSLFGGEDGGGFLGSLFGGAKAGGGDVSPGKAYLVGEQGPEIFNPDSAGAIIPHDATQAMIEAGGSGGGTTVVQAPAPVVNVRVENYSDPKEALDALDSPEGTQKVVNIIRKNPNAIKRT